MPHLAHPPVEVAGVGVGVEGAKEPEHGAEHLPAQSLLRVSPVRRTGVSSAVTIP